MQKLKKLNNPIKINDLLGLNNNDIEKPIKTMFIGNSCGCGDHPSDRRRNLEEVTVEVKSMNVEGEKDL